MPILNLHREVENLNRMILQLGGQVEENLRHGVSALRSRDPRQSEKIMDEDDVVDSLEVTVEELCLKILALHQPVASDLRYIVAVLKINGDLERIGDLASSLARHTTGLSRKKLVPVPGQIERLAYYSREMLNQSLNALVERNLNLCQRIVHSDKHVDALYMEMHAWFLEQVKLQPENADVLLEIFTAAKDLERIADHTCNIAEDVIYLVTGEIVRHHDLDDEE